MDWFPDLRQLRAFVAVVEEGSFTLAARRIFVTQSAVSHSLRTLEEQLSCRLLDRTGKRVAVTAEGELLRRRCKRVIFELEQASRDLDGLRRWGQIRIRIGVPHTAMSRQASSTVLPPAKASSALRSFLMISSGVCRFLFMGVVGAHAPGLS
jgi:DNA-binding transcriptional LysR family regulator